MWHTALLVPQHHLAPDLTPDAHLVLLFLTDERSQDFSGNATLSATPPGQIPLWP